MGCMPIPTLVPFMSGKNNFEFANIAADAKEQTLNIYINNKGMKMIISAEW